MASPRFDIVAIGNALVDVICHKDDDFVATQGLIKGQMAPVTPDRAVRLHADMGHCEEVSGGSAANTMAALATLGPRCAFVGQVGDDRLGRLFRQDMIDRGIAFDIPPLPGDMPTGRCLIIVHPDGHRTMNTAIGASEYLPEAALDPRLIADSAILYVEGYMLRTPEPRAAAHVAMDIARAAGRKTAFTLSAEWCIREHRDDYRALIDGGPIDILLANEGELLVLSGCADLDAAIAWAGEHFPLVIVTCGPDGAIAIEKGVRYTTPAEPSGPVVDTTGAGDLFAAGVLAGLIAGHDLPRALRMGSIAAGKVITIVGPRLPGREDLPRLIAERLG